MRTKFERKGVFTVILFVKNLTVVKGLYVLPSLEPSKYPLVSTHVCSLFYKLYTIHSYRLMVLEGENRNQQWSQQCILMLFKKMSTHIQYSSTKDQHSGIGILLFSYITATLFKYCFACLAGSHCKNVSVNPTIEVFYMRL